jgi:hypothetical protein
MARGARGAGAVFQRADGRWEAQLRIGPSRRRSLYAQTRPDVVAKLDQARWSMALGLPVRMPVNLTRQAEGWLDLSRWPGAATALNRAPRRPRADAGAARLTP